MYGNQYNIQRFLALADIYFRLTGKTASTLSGVEMEEFYKCITHCSAPEDLHKLIENKINIERDGLDSMDNVHPGGWYMLPPEQRII
jgi:hypothetical protein